jgi:hyperosmotically inducible protein
MRNILAVSAGVALLALAACGGEPTNNSTVNRANTNTAVVTNSNVSANASSNANSNASARSDNWNWNANREDFDRNANSWRASASNLGDKISTEAGDGWIHFKVRGALAGVNDLRDSTINVDVEKGVVTLRGSVANAAQKAAAEKAAKVDGVTRVTNSLVVRPGGDDANKNANANNK